MWRPWLSDITIDHQAPWIGIPEYFPFDGRWPTAGDWATALVSVLDEQLGEPMEGEADSLRDYLEVLAESRESRNASRVYILVTGWATDVYVVDLAVVPSRLLDDMSIEEFAGANDETTVEKPLVEPFVTTSGVGGLVCTRYSDNEYFGGLVARVDYVFPVPDAFVRLYTAQVNLVSFNRMLPRLAELAATLRVED